MLRLLGTLLSAGLLLSPALAQTKVNPFVQPPAETKKDPPAPPVKKTNPFLDPATPATKPGPTEKPSTEIPEIKPNKPGETVVVPFQRLPSGHFLVEVRLNGQGPYKLVFDTGAPLMLLNTRIAKAGGVIGKNRGGFSLFAGMNPETIKVLQVGSAVATNVPAVVMDHPTVAAISDAFEDEFGKIDGIVGFPFFARFAMTVDYQKKELRLVPNDYKPGDILRDVTNRVMMASQPEPKVLAPTGLWGFDVAKSADDKADGVTVKTVLPGSPAAKAGLKPGDRLETLDGRWTDSVGDTFLAASIVKPGATVPLTVRREGKVLTLNVTPGKGL